MYKEKLEALILELYPDIDPNLLHKEISLVELLGLDSLSFVNLVVEIEQLFDNSFKNTDIFDTNLTFDQILDIMERDFTDGEINS